MGFEVGKPFGLVARFGMNSVCCRWETPFDEVHHLVDTPLEGVVICLCTRGLLA